MKRLLLFLLALVLAAVAALAGDTVGGGEGGAINLPGGRNGSSSQSQSNGGQTNGGSASTWTVSGQTHLRLRVAADMEKAIVFFRGVDLPFAQTLAPVDGIITVTLETILALRAAGEPGFTLDLVTPDGLFLHVSATFRADGDLQVVAG